MKKSNNKKEIETKSIARIWIVLGLGGVTLYINSRMEDPFNTPKFIILFLTSCFLLAQIVSEAKRNGINEYKRLKEILIILTVFIAFAFISAVLTEVKFTAFFGEYQRRNGFLTYFSLVIFMVFSIFYSLKNDAKYFLKNVIWIGFIFAFYGALQSQGIDFVNWNNPYNSIIATVGNPNFASALASVMAVTLLAIVLSNQFNRTLRILSFFIILLSLYIIIKSQSRQGIVSFATGILAILTIIAWYKNKKLGALVGFSSLILAMVSIMGMLQIGPLEKFLYKDSVSVRGFYWRAGLEMFKSNPVFGVGFDRYGAYFKEFREAAYPLRYGYDITSSNAHNVIIQLFSTGGLVVGISYLLLIFFVLFRSLKLISNSSSDNRMIHIGLFGAWLTFQAQSLISIDNIGIAIWGWVISGILIGTSYTVTTDPSQVKSRKINQIDLFQPLLSTAILIPALVVSFMLYRSESHTWMARSFYNPNQPSMNSQLDQYSKSVLDNPLSDPFLKFRVTGYLVASGNSEFGLPELTKLNEQDPRNLDYLRVLAVYSYQSGNIDLSIYYRNQIMKYDPLNTNNCLELAKLYKLKSDMNSVEQMQDKILSLDPNGEDAKTIKLILSQ
jgi:O-antigen ligase